jgi:hypothetical protein
MMNLLAYTMEMAAVTDDDIMPIYVARRDSLDGMPFSEYVLDTMSQVTADLFTVWQSDRIQGPTSKSRSDSKSTGKLRSEPNSRSKSHRKSKSNKKTKSNTKSKTKSK